MSILPYLKPILSAVLLPPIALVVVGLLALLTGWRAARGRIIAFGTLFLLLLLSIPAVSIPLLLALEQDLATTPPADAPPQAIVILGGEVRRVSAGNDYQIGPASLERVRAGAALARRTGLPILVSGGAVYPREPDVAGLMARSLQDDFGVPARWVESDSRDTWQNAAMSAALLRQDGISSIYLVTHAWHMRRALLAFRQTGLSITAAPTYLDQPPTSPLAALLPSVGSWGVAYYALHEWIGVLWYALP